MPHRLIPFALALLFLPPAPAWAGITGQPRVIDGDTIEVAGQRIRLHGIDAPESRQLCRRDGERWQCGKDATSALKAFLGSRPVSCEELDRDRYRRIVAKCAVDGMDIGEWMVSQGWAVAYYQYSYEYSRAEQRAKSARRGMWAGEFEKPWEWRKQRDPALMPSEIDIYRSAKLLIDQHGEDAPIFAAMQADRCLEAEDLDGKAVWMGVIGAIKEPQDRQPTVFSGKFTLAGIYTNWA